MTANTPINADMIVELLRAEKPANYLDGDGSVCIEKKWISLNDIFPGWFSVPRDSRYYLTTSQDTLGMIVVLCDHPHIADHICSSMDEIIRVANAKTLVALARSHA